MVTGSRRAARRAVAVACARTGPSIASKPADPTSYTVARFQFIDTPIGVTLVCPFDGSGYMACSSPMTYRGLRRRAHVLGDRVGGTLVLLGGDRPLAAIDRDHLPSQWTDLRPPPLEDRLPTAQARGLWDRERFPWIDLRARLDQAERHGRYWNGSRFIARRAGVSPREVVSAVAVAPQHGVGGSTRSGFRLETAGTRSMSKRRTGSATPRVREIRRTRTLRSTPARRGGDHIAAVESVDVTHRSIHLPREGRGVRFRCHLKRSHPVACASPVSYRDLRVGVHTFTVPPSTSLATFRSVATHGESSRLCGCVSAATSRPRHCSTRAWRL